MPHIARELGYSLEITHMMWCNFEILMKPVFLSPQPMWLKKASAGSRVSEWKYDIERETKFFAYRIESIQVQIKTNRLLESHIQCSFGYLKDLLLYFEGFNWQ